MTTTTKEEDNPIFGQTVLEEFSNGDLVSWTPVGHPKEYGLIKEIFVQSIEDNDKRKIAFANIVTTNNKPIKLPLVHLLLESKRKCAEETTET